MGVSTSALAAVSDNNRLIGRKVSKYPAAFYFSYNSASWNFDNKVLSVFA